VNYPQNKDLWASGVNLYFTFSPLKPLLKMENMFLHSINLQRYGFFKRQTLPVVLTVLMSYGHLLKTLNKDSENISIQQIITYIPSTKDEWILCSVI